MPPAFEVLLLNTAIPQIQAAQSGDTYVVPRAIAFNAGVNVVNNDVTIYGVTVGRGAGAVSGNTAVGADALRVNTTGAFNTSIGYASLYQNLDGAYNTATGASALEKNTSGANNTAFGVQALQANTTASNNTAVGYQAGYTNQTGANVTYIGRRAGYLATGSGNTFVGMSSGDAVTSGAGNTILGRYTGNNGGLDIRTASNYIVLSDGDGNPRGIFDNQGNFYVGCTTNGALNNNSINFNLAAGYGFNSHVNHENGTASGVPYFLFNYNASTIGSIVQNGTSGVLYNITSDYRLKNVIGEVTGAGDRIDALEPVEYEWKASGERTRGFLAHKFQEVYPQSVSGTKDAVDADGNPVYQAMQASTSEVIADLVAEIQSLRKRLADAGIA